MKPLRFLLAFAAVASLASVACSSSGGDDDPPAGAGGAGASSTGFSSAAFSAYCSGTLLTEREVLRANGGGAWVGSGEKVPAGTKFLVEEGFDKWATGYLLLADGTVAKLDADFSKGLVKDVDFSTSCAAPVSFERHRLVMLKTTTLFPDKDLTGDAVHPRGRHGAEELGIQRRCRHVRAFVAGPEGHVLLRQGLLEGHRVRKARDAVTSRPASG